MQGERDDIMQAHVLILSQLPSSVHLPRDCNSAQRQHDADQQGRQRTAISTFINEPALHCTRISPVSAAASFWKGALRCPSAPFVIQYHPIDPRLPLAPVLSLPWTLYPCRHSSSYRPVPVRWSPETEQSTVRMGFNWTGYR